VIKRLSALLANSDETQFKDTLKAANMVGDEIADRIYTTIEKWEPQATTTTIPFENTITTQIGRQVEQTEKTQETAQSSPKQQPQNPSPQNNTDETAVDANEETLEYTSIDDFC
jgi:hypothetical protein